MRKDAMSISIHHVAPYGHDAQEGLASLWYKTGVNLDEAQRREISVKLAVNFGEILPSGQDLSRLW
jgi:hypothetical protein